jgi:DNA glycosylase AlkZ-like
MGAAERFRGQWLHRRRASAEAVVRHLLAVQAQDARSVRLALRARGASGWPDGLVTSWLLRGTLHTVCREDFWWLHGLCAPRLEAGNRRRLRQLGVTEAQAERAVALIARALGDGPLPRAALADVLAARGIPVAGQAIVHLLVRAALSGVVVLDAERRFVLAGERPPPPDRDAALRELARRYAAAHAGADARDLAHWSGLPLSGARRGLRDLAPPAPPRGPVPLRLIPAYDELLLGWRDRTPVVAPEHARRVHPGGGLLRAVVLEDGRAAGTWQLRAGRVTVEPFTEIADAAGLAAEIAAVERLKIS